MKLLKRILSCFSSGDDSSTNTEQVGAGNNIETEVSPLLTNITISAQVNAGLIESEDKVTQEDMVNGLISNITIEDPYTRFYCPYEEVVNKFYTSYRILGVPPVRFYCSIEKFVAHAKDRIYDSLDSVGYFGGYKDIDSSKVKSAISFNVSFSDQEGKIDNVADEFIQKRLCNMLRKNNGLIVSEGGKAPKFLHVFPTIESPASIRSKGLR